MYNICAEANGKRGVLLLNAITNHNLSLWAKRPSCADSRPVIRFSNDGKHKKGALFMTPSKEKRCSTCEEIKPITEFHKSNKEKDGYRSRCKDCRKIKEPYLAIKEYQDKYREDHREKSRMYLREYNSKRAAAQAEYYPKWKEANKEDWENYQREYYLQHIDKKLEYASQYAKYNPNVSQVANQRRRGRKLGRGTFTRQEWEDLKIKYSFTCLCCGNKEPEIKLSPDHVIPLARGGMNTIDNIQPLCRKCNNKKSARIKDYR